MAIEICRLCLSTNKTLQELNENLLTYFQDICDYTSGGSKHLCCSICKESLKSNLDFKNQCLKSNTILQEWKRNKSQKKTPLESLHKLLYDYIDNTKTKESNEFTKCGNTRKGNNYYSKNNEEIINKSVKDTINSYSGNNDEEIKVEIIKDEVKNYEIFDNGTDRNLNNHNELYNVTISDEQRNKSYIDKENYQSAAVNEILNHEEGIKIEENYIYNENSQSIADNETVNDEQGIKNDENDIFKDKFDSDDDDKFLIDCVGETVNTKAKKSKKVSKSKTKIKRVKKQEKRVYPRKGISDYSQYEAVFEIQLFTTDEDARLELLQRRLSEPYVSAQYRCELCYTVYKCDKLLQFHMRWHDPSAEFECDICSMRFAARKALQCHKAKCHRGRFTCKMCPLITYYGSAMKAHFQKHEGKLFKCHCDRVFNHISSYLTHKRTVHASCHVCVTCARTFVSELGLLNHRLRAHQSKSKVDSEGTARCEPCGLTFASQQVYTVHVLNTDRHKDAAKDIIACSHCGLSCDDAAQLKTHKRQLHPKKKDTHDTITCKLCGAEGTGRTWRRRHYGAEHPHVRYLEEVSEAKIHMCDQCGKRFSNICLMKDHMNSHLGLKPYACARCRATFTTAAARAQHAERHAPPTRACATCGARFRSASNLAVHMRTHAGIRRHACDICSKAFLHRATLREHVRGVHRHIKRARGQARDAPRAD